MKLKAGENATDEGLGWDDATKAGAAVTGLAAVLGALAVAGVLERMQRNHAGWLAAAVILALLAGLAWIAGSLTKKLRFGSVVRALMWLLRVVAALALAAIVWLLLRAGMDDVVLLLVALTGALVLGIASWPIGRAAVSPRAEKISPKVAFDVIAAVLFAVAVLVGLVGLVLTQQDDHRPSITASIKDESGLVLKAKVRAGGLRADEHLSVLVEGISWKDRRPGDIVRNPHYAGLYQAWLGPDADGKVEHDIEVPLRAVVGAEKQDEIGIRAFVVPPCAAADNRRRQGEACPEYPPPPCYARPARKQTGCITVRLPRGPTGPQLTAAWEGATAGLASLTLGAAAANVRPDTGSLRVSVYGENGGKTTLVASARFRPNERGVVTSKWKVPVAGRYETVCAVAALAPYGRITDERLRCPPRDPEDTAWVRLLALPDS